MRNIKIKKGFSLIELMLTFAILVVLVIGAFITYKKVKVDNEANAIISDINIVTSNYKNIALSKNGSLLASDTDDYTGIFNFVTKDIYKTKTFSLAGSSSSVYMNKNSMLQLVMSEGFFSGSLMIDKDACPKVVTKLLASGVYMINSDSLSGDSITYVSKNNSLLGTLPAGLTYSTNYNSTDIIKVCSIKMSSDIASALGDSANGISALSSIQFLYLG